MTVENNAISVIQRFMKEFHERLNLYNICLKITESINEETLVGTHVKDLGQYYYAISSSAGTHAFDIRSLIRHFKSLKKGSNPDNPYTRETIYPLQVHHIKLRYKYIQNMDSFKEHDRSVPKESEYTVITADVLHYFTLNGVYANIEVFENFPIKDLCDFFTHWLLEHRDHTKHLPVHCVQFFYGYIHLNKKRGALLTFYRGLINIFKNTEHPDVFALKMWEEAKQVEEKIRLERLSETQSMMNLNNLISMIFNNRSGAPAQTSLGPSSGASSDADNSASTRPYESDSDDDDVDSRPRASRRRRLDD